MKQKLTKFGKAGTQSTVDFVSQLEAAVNKTTNGVDTYIAPVRSNIFKRFPILFSLATTFGVATTFLGFEKLVSRSALLDNHPLLMLIVGMSILALTGTLYKNLS